jgi:hypothetical protein
MQMHQFQRYEQLFEVFFQVYKWAEHMHGEGCEQAHRCDTSDTQVIVTELGVRSQMGALNSRSGIWGLKVDLADGSSVLIFRVKNFHFLC